MKRLITLIVGVLCTAPWSVRAQFDDAAAAQLQKLVQAYRYVDAAYVDSLDTAPLVEEAIRGMLTRLDPHSAYLSEEEMKGVDESFDGSFGGIGIEFNVLNDTVVIVNTIAGGPSAQVGLLPGDRIVGIDGQRAVGLSRAEVPERLRGPSGTQVRLEVSRHAVKEPLAFTVTRGDIPLHTVDAAYKVDAETGYIKVNRFGRTTMQEFVEAFKGMKGVRSLILDLRGNGGGLLDQFLPQNWIPMFHHHASMMFIQIGIGLCFTTLYFVVFRTLILRLNLKTPGREESEIKLYSKADYQAARGKTTAAAAPETRLGQAAGFLQALGGADNIESINNCATRLRIALVDMAKTQSDDVFKALGAHGVVRRGNGIQVIVGLHVPQVRDQLENLMKDSLSTEHTTMTEAVS